MTKTSTMSETGGLELPEAVRRYLELPGSAELEVECKAGAVRLRPRMSEADHLVPEARGELRHGRLVIVDSHVITDEELIVAIEAGRDERAN